MEYPLWRQVWLASEAAMAAEECIAKGQDTPDHIEQQLSDNIGAIDAAYQELFPRFEGQPDQAAVSAALHEALLSSQPDETELSICLRTICMCVLARSHNPGEQSESEPSAATTETELSTVPSPKDDPELFRRLHTSEQTDLSRAQAEIIEKYGNFVYKKARNIYRHLPQKPGVDYDDLVQEGLIALLHSAELYKPGTSEATFLTYAQKGITQRILRCYDNTCSTVRVPEDIRENIRKIDRQNEYRRSHRLPSLSIDQIAALTGVEPNLTAVRNRHSTSVGNILRAQLLGDYMGSLEGGFSPHDMGPGNDYVVDEQLERPYILESNIFCCIF
jgi:RNA polymerase sigma factor (sigma-70 family)